MILDGTAQFGEKCKFHKLTTEQVAEIRILLDDNENSAEIAAAYDISRRQIDRIKNNKQWKIK
jgi:DNA invertase Pin-like site-specific DNA recombinase